MCPRALASLSLPRNSGTSTAARLAVSGAASKSGAWDAAYRTRRAAAAWGGCAAGIVLSGTVNYNYIVRCAACQEAAHSYMINYINNRNQHE